MTDQEEKLLLEKEQEIKNQLAAAGFSEKIYEELKACGAINYEFDVEVEEVLVPKDDDYHYKEGELIIGLITMDRYTKKKKSVKICNSVYNIQNLIKSIVNCSTNITSAVKAYEVKSWFALGIALFALLNNAKAAITIDLTDDEAKVLISLLSYFGGKHRVIGIEDGLLAVNDQLELYGYKPMDKMTYNRALDRLSKIHAIDLIDDTILILENVSKKATI